MNDDIKTHDNNLYEICVMDAYDLYDVLKKELKFDTMITLYRLLKTKIETLNDEVRNEYGICRGDDK